MTVATAGEGHAAEDRFDEVRAARRFEIAEQHRQQQHDLESLTEQNEERLCGHQCRRADTRVGDRPLRLVEHSAEHDDLVADLVDRPTVLDRRTDRCELELSFDREVVVGHPQRCLDQLEMRQVARLGLLQRPFGIAGLDQGQRFVDRLARLVEQPYRLAAGHSVGGGRTGREQHDRQRGDKSCGADRGAAHDDQPG